MPNRAVSWLWGVALFMPYPSIPVGGNTGLQLGHLLMLGLLPLALLSHRKLALAWAVLGLLALPQVVNLFATGFAGTDLNVAVLQVFTMAALPVTALVFARHPAAMLKGVFVMLSVHGVAGLYQALAFSQEVFPWPWLFVNPSFAPLDEETQELIAQYIRRPFGLMPEPSTLVAYTAPWLLLLLAALAERRRPGQGDPHTLFAFRAVHVAGLAALLVTYLLGQSGGVVFFGLGVAALIAVHCVRNAQARPVGVLVLASAVVLVGVAASLALSGRVESESQALGSWDERATSIQVGLQMIRDASALQLLLGYGGGQVARIADSQQATAAVHSWVLTYVDSFGLLGAAALLTVIAIVARCVWGLRDRVVWSIVMLSWIPGPLLMSGYYQILGAWGLLALPIVLSGAGGVRSRSPAARPEPVRPGAQAAARTPALPAARLERFSSRSS